MKASLKNILLLNVSFIILLLFIISCQEQTDYSKELKPLVDKYVEVWNNGNVNELDTIMTDDFIRHAESTSAEGLENLKKLIINSRTAFPDINLNLTDEIFSRDRYAARFSFTATNTGPGQLPPTGNSVEVWGVVIAHFSNGKLTEEWVGYDNQSFMQQLGFVMVPPSEE